MSGSQEIRTQIASIQNTQKITKAMEMVAASKMKKAQDQMTKARPYADKILNVIKHLAHAHPEYTSEFFAQRDVSKKGYIIISSDRGLCGGLNNNLFKRSFYFNFRISFNNITDFNIIKILNRDTTFIAFLNFINIILKSF